MQENFKKAKTKQAVTSLYIYYSLKYMNTKKIQLLESIYISKLQTF